VDLVHVFKNNCVFAFWLKNPLSTPFVEVIGEINCQYCFIIFINVFATWTV